MYSVTWISPDNRLHSIATPNAEAAHELHAILPRARLWYTARKHEPMLLA